ncbi:MAG: hypothetical protein AABX19_02965 [Nanoarchaeota archaeon]
MKTKNFFITLSLEILFTILIISLLFYSRDKTRGYISSIQEFSPEISKLQEELGKSNLTSYDQSEVKDKLDDIEKTLDDAVLLNKYIVPISIILLSLVFYFFIWKFTNGISVKNFFLSAIVPLFLLFVTIISFLNYLAFIYLGLDSDNFYFLVSFIILLIISYYISLVSLSYKNNGFVDSVKFSFYNFKHFILQFILILISNIVLLSLILVIFVLSYAGYSIIIPSVILLVLLIIINIQRFYFVKKVNRL